MTPERWQRIEEIYYEARRQAVGARPAFLAEACAGDETLHNEVLALLQADKEAGDFLDAPAVAWMAEELEENAFVGREFGHYRILAPLGAGGMGEVYLAQDSRLDRKVALKILPREFTRDPDRVHRFTREAKAASALNHPNIITIHEIGTLQTADGELHFIATEYIEGETLRQRLKHGPLNWPEALDAAAQTAAALAAAHRAGIIHRDIKPENLMLRPDGYLKVLDFGLARINKPAQHDNDDSTTRRFLETHPGAVMGTLSYMSPEQARGERVDGRTDLWSLGVVLYELLTGVRPFSAATLPDMMVALLEREPPPLSQYLPHAPPELAALLRRALMKSAATRLQTAQEFTQALRDVRRHADEMVTLPPPPAPASANLAEAPTRMFAKLTEPFAQQETLPAIAKAAALPATAEAAREPRRRVWLPLALAAALAASLAAWRWLPVSPANPSVVTNAPVSPERKLSYLLEKKRVGQSYEKPSDVQGRWMVESDAALRFTFNSEQEGYVYLINEGSRGKGQSGLIKLFPEKTQSAKLAANEPLTTGNYNFDEHKGTETIWLIWAANPVPGLDGINVVEITDDTQADAGRRFLQEHKNALFDEGTLSAQGRFITLRGRGDVLLKKISLERQ